MADGPSNLRQRRTSSFPVHLGRRDSGSPGRLGRRVRHVPPLQTENLHITPGPYDGNGRAETFERPPLASPPSEPLPGLWRGPPPAPAPYFPPASSGTQYGPQDFMYLGPAPRRSAVDPGEPHNSWLGHRSAYEWVRRKTGQGKRRSRKSKYADSSSGPSDSDSASADSGSSSGYRSRTRRYSASSSDYTPGSPYRAHSLANSYDSDEFEEILGGRVFHYVPARVPPTTSDPLSNSELDDSKDEEKTDSSARDTQHAPTSLKGPEVLHICHSQYTGEPLLDGVHTAKLTIVHDLKRQRRPLFRWMHLEQHTMNLDELAIEMSRLPAITDAERNGFAKLLSEVKRNVKIRPTLNGGSVRHMEPGTIRVNLPPEGRPTLSTTPRSLTWLSMPYFSIEKYAGLLSAGTPSSFPLETLLQSEYSRTTQEREEQQVVWQTNQPKEAHCFHVAQVWCIVLDNSLLLTCGRMSGAALRRDLITVAPGSFGEVGVQSKALYVSYYDSVLLELPLTSCLTWFEFSIQFHEFWPQAVSFYHHDRLLTAKDWPRIVNLAQHSNTRITLDLRLGEHPPPFTEGILRPLNPGAEEHDEAEETADHGSDPLNATTETPDLGPMLSCSVNDRFHVFSWMDTVQMKENPQVLNQKALRKQLEDAEQYIMNYAELKDRRSYRNCPRSSRRKVHDYLNEQRIRVETAQDLSHKDLDFEEKVALYNMCDILYDFFLPPNVDDELPMSGSFWGAVQEIVKMSQSRKDGSEADDDDRNASSRHERRSRQRPRYKQTQIYPNMVSLTRTLRSVLQRIQSFQSIMSNAPTTARTRVAVPDSLVRAWLHLILALVQSTSNKETSDENHIYVADALIKKGLGEIMDNLPTGDLLRHFVVQPMDIVALLSEKLIRDSTGQYPNISDTYSEYLKKLGNEIMTKTANRTNQLHFPLFRQEIDIIKHIIDTQKTIVGSMRNPVHSSGDATRKEKMMLALEHEKSMKKYQKAPSYSHHHQPNYHSYSRPYGRTSRIMELTTDYDNSPEDFAKMSATDPGGFLEVFRWTCDAWLERRRAEFDEFADEARRLETMNANKVEATKDRQEAAVYAFTMVTIVFLPLSTISSIFGMNSRDVRDMAAGQWLYWAVALPTTAAVIVAGLAWMGELRPVVDWLLLRRRRRRSAAAGPPQYYWWPPPPPARNPNPDPFAPALPPYPPPAALPPYALPARYTARSYY